MIERNPQARAARAVVLGAGGFVARALADRLARAMPVVRLDRAALDLTARDAADRLVGQLDADDALVFVAANPGCLGSPFSSGDVVHAQGWYRDPAAPKTTNLTDALEFVLQP